MLKKQNLFKNIMCSKIKRLTLVRFNKILFRAFATDILNNASSNTNNTNNTNSTNLTNTNNNTNIPNEGKTFQNQFNILFFGNDAISLPTLIKLYEETRKGMNVVKKLSVLTTPCLNSKSPQSALHTFIDNKQINKFELIKNKFEWEHLLDKLKEDTYDIGIIASFGKMIPDQLIDYFKKGIFVMHPSILPKYRGACPIQYAILNNDKTTGVSIVEASKKKFDAGDIISQQEILIDKFDRFSELSKALGDLGADEIINFLHNYDYLIERKKKQDKKNKSLAKIIIDQTFFVLQFKKLGSSEIFNKYKAFYGTYQHEPYTKILINDKPKLLFFDNLVIVSRKSETFTSFLGKIDSKSHPGTLYWNTKLNINYLFIKSQDDWLLTSKVKLDGTDYMDGNVFIKKYLRKPKGDKPGNFEILL